MLEKQKKTIQTRFLNELSLRVDFSKQGCVTTNDGNTARRFFENQSKSAEIKGKINFF